MVGDAAGFTINSGLVIRGMDLAVGSGIAAAEAIVEAKEKNDFSASSLSAYKRLLDESFVMKDLKLYAKAPVFMENDRLYKSYSKLANDLFGKVYTHDLTPKELLLKTAMKALKENKISLFDLAIDGFKGVRAL
jgi:electron transfer flavoprotein-quinone oxidoreductase